MQPFTSLYCIDGSGAQNRRTAEKKRPIYRVEGGPEARSISRVMPADDPSPLKLFQKACEQADGSKGRVLIAADVVIGLPREPRDVWRQDKTFPKWLERQGELLGHDPQDWRDRLIAEDLSSRSKDRPFTKVKKGTKAQIAFKRDCDQRTNAESVYCIDSGAKQVGRASLQFWFEVLLPLRVRYPDRVAIWPFEEVGEAAVVVAECYPALCQQQLGLPKNIKTTPSKVVEAVASLRERLAAEWLISDRTWLHGVSSEDEYDMLTTACWLALSNEPADLLALPANARIPEIDTIEGWMMGLSDDG